MSDIRNTADTVMEFPCRFPIKVMGKQVADFDAQVVAVIRRHVTNLDEGAVRSRHSSNGAFISVTVTIEAHSREQLDAIYLDLTACPDFLMVL